MVTSNGATVYHRIQIRKKQYLNTEKTCSDITKTKKGKQSFSGKLITCTSCGPANFRNVAFVCAAHARAMSVLPVPGGPYKRTPFGGRIPNFWNRSLCVMGRTIASTSS